MAKQLFKNPYFFTKEDFEKKENNNTYDDVVTLTDCSGYLCLRDQIAVIKEQSAINNEFRRGQVDKFNYDKKALIQQLSEFEENDFVINQLHKAKSGDLIDKEQIYKNAYDLGRQAGFYPQNSPKGVQEPPSTVGDGADEGQPPVNNDTGVNK